MPFQKSRKACSFFWNTTAPPFNAGTPRTAPKDVFDKLQSASAGRYADRAKAVSQAAARLALRAVVWQASLLFKWEGWK